MLFASLPTITVVQVEQSVRAFCVCVSVCVSELNDVSSGYMAWRFNLTLSRIGSNVKVKVTRGERENVYFPRYNKFNNTAVKTDSNKTQSGGLPERGKINWSTRHRVEAFQLPLASTVVCRSAVPPFGRGTSVPLPKKGGHNHLTRSPSHLTHCRLGWGQVASWSIELFGHNRYRPKIGGCAPLGRDTWVSI